MYQGEIKALGVKEAAQDAKRKNGRESVGLRELMSRKFGLQATVSRMMHRTDLVKLIDEGKAQWLVETMGPLKSETGEFICVGNIPDLALRPLGQTTVSRAERTQARAEAELKAAWENLAEVARSAARTSRRRKQYVPGLCRER